MKKRDVDAMELRKEYQLQDGEDVFDFVCRLEANNTSAGKDHQEGNNDHDKRIEEVGGNDEIDMKAQHPNSKLKFGPVHTVKTTVIDKVAERVRSRLNINTGCSSQRKKL